MNLPTYQPEACPLCADGIEVSEARLTQGLIELRCFKLTLAYDGAAFAGWQRQDARHAGAGGARGGVRAYRGDAGVAWPARDGPTRACMRRGRSPACG